MEPSSRAGLSFLGALARGALPGFGNAWLLVTALGASEPAEREAWRKTILLAPEVQAAEARLAAARAGIEASGRLPDPVIETQGGLNQMGRLGQRQVMVMQEFPRYGELRGMQQMALAGRQRAQAEFEIMLSATAAEVAMALIEVEDLRARETIARQQVERAKTLLATLQPRLAAGTARASEKLSVDNRIGELEIDASEQERMAADAENTARVCCGIDAGTPLPRLVLPDLEPTPASPGEAMLQAEAAEARAGELQARSQGNPGFSVGLGYEEDDGMRAAMARLTISLPVWRGSVAAAAAAARHRLAASAAALDNQRRQAELVRSRARRSAAWARTTQSTIATMRTRLQAEWEAAVQELAAGTMPMVNALEVLDRLGDLERRRLDAFNTSRRDQAALWRQVPLSTSATGVVQ